jgi:probable rRNA maturation factor
MSSPSRCERERGSRSRTPPARQSKELGTSIEQEFFVLFVHGLLHLLGYDHGSKEEKKEMEIMSKMILEGVE